ncbi:hypothetical protein MRB53_033951 [Persea americana]|uniref:Uncharacterized protein n=1 Tax=Persea americana TaxID=3435 RepID=A0ACC2KVY2_PERAE|nr:hypothetical protein MRB53_033951 [Persea americana]
MSPSHCPQKPWFCPALSLDLNPKMKANIDSHLDLKFSSTQIPKTTLRVGTRDIRFLTSKSVARDAEVEFLGGSS